MTPSNYVDAVATAVRESTPRDLLPDDGHDLTSLFRLYALVARVKGDRVTAEDVHDAWSVWMLSRAEAHDAIRPFADLDGDVQREDEPFAAAVRAAARSAGRAAAEWRASRADGGARGRVRHNGAHESR